MTEQVDQIISKLLSPATQKKGVAGLYDKAMHAAVQKVLGAGDKIVGVQMPYTPRCLRFTQDVKLAVWDSIKWKMEESICEARSKADKT